MENGMQTIILTGFMGVGKTTVARHLAYLLRKRRVDLDGYISKRENRSIAEILEQDGESAFRELETKYLKEVLDSSAEIISLGGGAWTVAVNRELVKEKSCVSVWLESTFDHCWRNIRFSRFERPLAKDKKTARKLFETRQRFYCLADWHFAVKPGNNSFDVAKQIADEVVSERVD